MRYLSIGLNNSAITVAVDTCLKCFIYGGDKWWDAKLWQNAATGKIHKVSTWRPGRTECGLLIPKLSLVTDRHIAVNVQ